jgi:CRISPR-associated protein (TIGR02710 family)
MSSREVIDDKFEAPDRMKGHGYEIVEDLLLNAERRAVQERYDDAVGRLYRALELLAQIRLQQAYGIKTGDVDVQKLPTVLQQEYEQKRSPERKKVQLALRNSYVLLSQLDADPLGQLYQEHDGNLFNALQTRNNSLFAHGFQPITASDYQKFSQVIVSFIQAGITRAIPSQSKLHPVQFPRALSI